VLAIQYVIISGFCNTTFNRGAINRSATQVPSLNTFSMFCKEGSKDWKQGLEEAMLKEKIQMGNG